MLTYTLLPEADSPLYEQLTAFIKKDIASGVLKPGEKLPSKRSFARNLGISTITVETAYQQLLAEGYILSAPRRGYFAADIRSFLPETALRKVDRLPMEGHAPEPGPSRQETDPPPGLIDFSGNETARENFPFSAWARVSREELSLESSSLVTASPGIGILPLREAIADHLLNFRGLHCDPSHIVIGAGTEYLYGLLIQLLGFSRIYGVEDPGYRKISRVYESHGVDCRYIPLITFEKGVRALQETGADILHISPSHHFPTGRVMPIRERNEVLKWAAEGDRYIIEDDYDSEFRLVGQPIPALFETDPFGKVIYMNTFTKTLSSTVRISYMVLPEPLMQEFRRRLDFYSCTVSNFEQYTLTRFIREGYFERHLNRMRNYYRAKRDRILKQFTDSPLAPLMSIREENAGLHFLLALNTELSDEEFSDLCRARGIRITPLSLYYHDPARAPRHIFIINYSSLKEEKLPEAARIMAGILKDHP